MIALHAARRIAILAAGLVLAAEGCGPQVGEYPPASRLSEAQRDTAIARSEIPGAATVGRALETAGRDADGSAALDSLTRAR